MRSKSAIYTPKQDSEHPRHFNVRVHPPPPQKPGSRHVFENYNDNYNLLAFHRCFSNISVIVLLSNIQCSRRILFFLNPGQVSIIPLYTPDGCQVVFSTGWSRGQLFSSFEKRYIRYCLLINQCWSKELCWKENGSCVICAPLGRHIGRHMSTDTWPISLSIYRSSVGRYVDRLLANIWSI